jgi:SET domain
MRIVFPKVLIELRPSRLDGVGVFAAAPLKTDQRIAAGIADADYRRLISWSSLADYDAAVREKIAAFCISTPDGFIPPDKLDFNRLSVEWYLNHSCDGNVGFDEDGDFVARRAVRKGDELTYDYALAESNPLFRKECRCGSAHCRRVITGNDWKDPGFREKNFDYMLPRLRRISDIGRPESAKTIRMVARRR